MLDECKGERLEEVLAVFSNAVLKKVLQNQHTGFEALAQQLALENFSYTGERTVLSSLILAHKVSLSKHLRGKEEARARYYDFSDLLNLTERRVARRHEQLKQAMEENKIHGKMSQTEVHTLQDTVQNNWSGNADWLESILYGDSSKSTAESFLATRFEKVWQYVDVGNLDEIEDTNPVGLLEQLNARVKDQESRLARWQDFGKSLLQATATSPLKNSAQASSKPSKLDLGFSLHQTLQIGKPATEKAAAAGSASLDEYTRLIENMRTELANVGKLQALREKPARQSLGAQKRESLLLPSPAPSEKLPNIKDEEWSSASDSEGSSHKSAGFASKSLSRTPPSEAPAPVETPDKYHAEGVLARPPVPHFPAKANQEDAKPQALKASKPETLEPEEPLVLHARPSTPPQVKLSSHVNRTEIETDLADQILDSVSAASPSPKKVRHTLSLAERTRLSMSRTSHSQFYDLHDEFEIADLPRLAIKSRPSMSARTPSSELDPHADLIERTRKSMAGFEAAQKKAQVERRRSVKEGRKKQRESSYFPKVEEEALTPEVNTVELLEEDPDYESVFKSRPKIKTSPAVSPSRIWEEDED